MYRKRLNESIFFKESSLLTFVEKLIILIYDTKEEVHDA